MLPGTGADDEDAHAGSLASRITASGAYPFAVRRRWGWAILASAVLVAGCSGDADDAGVVTPSVSPTQACPVGQSTLPPPISNLSIDGVSAATYRTPLSVPSGGLDTPRLDGPPVVRIEVTAAESNAPVTFTALGGQVIESLDDSWVEAPDQLTVFSLPGAERCTAAVYVFATKPGTVNLAVEGATILTGALDVVVPREGARNVSLRLEETTVLAGESVQATATVSDAFGNAIPNAVVVLSTPRKGPGRFLNGATRQTLITDSRGRASIDVLAVAGRGTTLTVRAEGDDASCIVERNQYDCPIDVPVPGFTASSGRVSADVPVEQPSATLISPSAGTVLSAGEPFSVTASTTGLSAGTIAQVKLGGNVIALGSVDEDGRVSITDIVAVENRGRSYQFVVGDLAPIPISLTVVPFGITGATRDDTALTFTVTPGAWAAGTEIGLTRDGILVSRTPVLLGEETLEITVPFAPGVYQVRVRIGGSVVEGQQAYPIL